MRVLTLSAQKGGSGKSTLSLSLAVAALQDGEQVAGLDADPQRSFAKWGERRGTEDIEVRAISANEIDVMLTRAKRNGFTLVVVDTPGALNASVTHILRRSDLCLIPCRPSLMDIEATAELSGALSTMKQRYAYVLSQTDKRAQARVEETRKILAGPGLVAPTEIGWRTAHQDAINSGCGATELDGSAGQEIADLWSWVRTQLPPRV